MAKLLVVCNEDRATSLQRRYAFEDLGHQVDVIFTNLLDQKVNFIKRFIWTINFRLGYFPERNSENKLIKERIQKYTYDIIFIEKGLSIKFSTIKFIKKRCPDVKVISYTLDDMLNPHNMSKYFLKSLPLYDFHFTNKKYNVEELKQLGAKNVFYFRNGYSPRVHRPIEVSDKEREYFGSDVTFIGTYEKERAETIQFLADNGIKIKIWGWGKSSSNRSKNILNMFKHVYNDEYAKVIASSKINLCFLRKINRDTETTRSIEIPACGGFMLAERTQEHLELFEEGIEAEYFASNEELLGKIIFYLNNEEVRKKLGANGYRRCLNSGYSYNDQLDRIIKITMGNA